MTISGKFQSISQLVEAAISNLHWRWMAVSAQCTRTDNNSDSKNKREQATAIDSHSDSKQAAVVVVLH